MSLDCHTCGVTYLGYFTQSPSLLAEVDDHAAAAILSLLDGLLDTENQVRSAGADIRTEDVASVALEDDQLRLQGRRLAN